MKTATPPKGVTARWVSRRITRSPESRAVISCGTGLSEEFASTLLYRKHLHAEYSSASEFRFRESQPLPHGRGSVVSVAARYACSYRAARVSKRSSGVLQPCA